MERIIIVTGASSGIGKEIATKFINANDFVLLVGRNKKRLENIAIMHNELCESFVVDVSNTVEVNLFYETVKSKYKTVDVLINAAGFAKPVSTNMDIKQAIQNWDAVISTNLRGSFLMSINAASLLRRPGGRIINISSIGAFTGGSNGSAIGYAASKAGVNGLTFGLARELSKEGITVNSIAPGFIENTGFTSVYSEETVSQIVKSIPANRAGTVNDIAELCHFLSTEKASYITGEIININGGWLFGR